MILYTFTHCVPLISEVYIEFLRFDKVLRIILLGDICTSQLTEKLINFFPKIHIWDTYGPAEVSIQCTSHLVDTSKSTIDIPIGKPLPNYICWLLDDYFQLVPINQKGEIFVGGVGVFAGYLGRDDLTARVLFDIDGQMFYRTGDLGRLDNHGLLYYVGRKDYQVKLRGQRIELKEIEQCLLEAPITACVVMKWNDDHLIAYVQSTDVKTEELHELCQSRLPVHMIPSMFIVLKQLPMNANGKVDRKKLPKPEFKIQSIIETDRHSMPLTILEEKVHHLWCQVLQQHNGRISTTANFFSIGGHSLMIIQLYYLYQLSFGLDTKTLSIEPFLRQATIVHHAHLLNTIEVMQNVSEPSETHVTSHGKHQY